MKTSYLCDGSACSERCVETMTVPAKLINDGPGRYICSNCKELGFKFGGRSRSIDCGYLGWYCPDCGAHFTNLTRDEFGSLRVKEE